MLKSSIKFKLSTALLLVSFNLQAAESTEFDWSSLPSMPNASGHANVLATFELPATDISKINPNVDLGDLSLASKNGFPHQTIPGVGSALVPVPGKAGEFFMMTDRGVNFDYLNSAGKSNGKVFPLPNFTPAILHVKLADKKIEIIRAIPIVGSNGKPVTGLSNNKDDETPYANSMGRTLDFNPAGLDAEALQLLPNGHFLIAEEYGPSIAVVDTNGQVLVRYVPIGKSYAGVNYPVKAILPAIYKERRGNRGFENLSITPSGNAVYVTLQSPLGDAKDKTLAKSRAVRVLRLDISQPTDAKVTGMFLVLQTSKSAYLETDAQKDLKYSDAIAFEEDKLLLLERATKKVKLIVADLSQATNILNHAEANSVLFEKESEALEKLGIQSAQTREVFDSRDVFLKIDTDKLEGLALLSPSTIAISNDNDFGVGDNINDYPSKVWVVRLGKSLSAQ